MCQASLSGSTTGNRFAFRQDLDLLLTAER